MYARKRGRPSVAADQTRDVLIRIIHAKQPSLEDHAGEVALLCQRVGRRFWMSSEQLDELVRAAALHDVGKIGIPDAILDKAGSLTGAERDFVRQHTLLGERILNAAPALRPVAMIVRASHDRWDGPAYLRTVLPRPLPHDPGVSADASRRGAARRFEAGSLSAQRGTAWPLPGRREPASMSPRTRLASGDNVVYAHTPAGVR